ncbi:hypothetical protein EBB59_12200, partial [Lysobacter pythonis]
NEAIGRTYFLSDHQNSTRALTNAAGQVVNRYDYDPYGNARQSAQGFSNPYQYTGRERDQTGLMYYRARYYRPDMGRFIAEDPIGLAGGLNTYAYVGGNPVNAIDPLGLEEFSCIASRPNEGNYINGTKQCGYSCTSKSTGCSVNFLGPGYTGGFGSQMCRGAIVQQGVSPSGKMYETAEGYGYFNMQTSPWKPSGLWDSLLNSGFLNALEKAVKGAAQNGDGQCKESCK